MFKKYIGGQHIKYVFKKLMPVLSKHIARYLA